MEAGKLRKRVTLQIATESKDSVGAVKQTWNNLRTIWASIEPLSGRERYSLDQVKAGLDHEITVRAESASDVSPKMRVKYDDPKLGARFFDIESVVDEESRNIVRRLLCKEAR